MGLRIVVAGAAGRMGKEAIKAIAGAPDLTLVGALTGRQRRGEDAGRVAGIDDLDIPLRADLATVLDETRPDVYVDLTVPSAVSDNLTLAAQAGVFTVVGTTGLTADRLSALDLAFRERERAVLVCPNFALGAVLMIAFARQAKRWFPDAAVVEMHHATKRDAPSGTALRTAEAIARTPSVQAPVTRISATGREPLALGEIVEGVPVHSIRLPGLLAHQEVMFGGSGQVLTIRHDAMSRECYMPGLLLAIRQVHLLRGLVVGLEHLLDLPTA